LGQQQGEWTGHSVDGKVAMVQVGDDGLAPYASEVEDITFAIDDSDLTSLGVHRHVGGSEEVGKFPSKRHDIADHGHIHIADRTSQAHITQGSPHGVQLDAVLLCKRQQALQERSPLQFLKGVLHLIRPDDRDSVHDSSAPRW
jgi:hypothetical protein